MMAPDKSTSNVKVTVEVEPGVKEGNEARRNKTNPISCFSEGEVSSLDELSKVCFSGTPLNINLDTSAIVSSDELESPKRSNLSSEVSVTTMCSYLADGTSIPIMISSVSREGRDKQRWEEDSTNSSLIRLTTGTVPICNDGRILLVSSARKKEWILPKGGWESDESMEQSAARETYEEAGMLGILGPKLSSVFHETRKAKKRRMESRSPSDNSTPELSKFLTADDVVSLSNSSCGVSSEDELFDSLAAFRPRNFAFHISNFSLTSVEKNYNNMAPSRTELNTPSVIDSNTKKYQGVNQMTLFPLYVTEVLNTWPESGRSRKIVTIDEAIELVNREELKTALMEVRKRGLNHITNIR